jgi:prolyl-tRNA synthetase
LQKENLLKLLETNKTIICCVDQSFHLEEKTTTKVDSTIQKLIENSIPMEIVQGDFRDAKAHDSCATHECSGKLAEQKGIEVGHIFYLGKKYSVPLNAKYVNQEG